MNRRRFLAFLGALGPGLALARAGMGAPAPLAVEAVRTGVGRYTVTLPWRGDARVTMVVTAVDYDNGVITIGCQRGGL